MRILTRILVLIFITLNLFLPASSFNFNFNFNFNLKEKFMKFFSKNDLTHLPVEEKRRKMAEVIGNVFQRGFHYYGRYVFPHDELKPVSGTATDCLAGFGDVNPNKTEKYNGSGISLIESLSSLVIMGNDNIFKHAIRLLLTKKVNFDVDARINLFEWNRRVLGGLVSAHILANKLVKESYNNELLDLAKDLGIRFLPAFDTPTGLPYPWINLRYGVKENETTETTTAECGSLILEMGVLSHLTSDTRFEAAALRALRKLWSMRSPLDLLGTKLDIVSGKWIDSSSGIGAGIDSFYDCLLKGYFLFGGNELWLMFESAYTAVQRYIRYDDTPYIRYKTVDMETGKETNLTRKFSSLQAFWPGLQVLIGDIRSANSTHRDFYNVWKKYGGLPNTFRWMGKELGIIDGQYPLRPELLESTFYLHQATRDEWYFNVGEDILNALLKNARTNYGYASIKDLMTKEKEDYQPGYFFSETIKYLYLIYNDSFLDTGDYIFTTGGHPLPVMLMKSVGNNSNNNKPKSIWDLTLPFKALEAGKKSNALSNRVCPIVDDDDDIQSVCHVPDSNLDNTCSTNEDCGIHPLTCVPRECIKGKCSQKYFYDDYEEQKKELELRNKIIIEHLKLMNKFTNVTLLDPKPDEETDLDKYGIRLWN